jgi:hypothetical protein
MSLPETSRKDAPRNDSSRPLRSRPRAWVWKHQIGWLVGAAVVLAVVIQVRSIEGDRTAEAKPRAKVRQSADALPRVERPQHDVMALVNGQDISRKDLLEGCVSRHGKEVLGSLVNKRLILNHCEKRGITITNEEIAAEIDRMAGRFQLGREQWRDILAK